MRQHLNNCKIHRQTDNQTNKQTNRHLAICTLTTFWTVQDDQANFQASDQKTPFTKSSTFEPRGSKLIFQTGNGIGRGH